MTSGPGARPDRVATLGAGELSPAAVARLARARDAEPVRLPPRDDLGAVARWRDEIHRAWTEGDPPPAACGHRPDRLGDVRVLRSRPDPEAPLALYLHGGGYALGSPEVALPITERLARGCEVVSVDYRLAPEHPCPAAIEDGVAAYGALADRAPGRAHRRGRRLGRGQPGPVGGPGRGRWPAEQATLGPGAAQPPPRPRRAPIRPRCAPVRPGRGGGPLAGLAEAVTYARAMSGLPTSGP